MVSRKAALLPFSLLLLLFLRLPSLATEILVDASAYGVRGDAGDTLQTHSLQKALDAAGSLAAQHDPDTVAVVRLPAGRILSGALVLNTDHVLLEIPENTTLAGSLHWQNYGQGGWGDAFLSAHGRSHIGIRGTGILTGQDVENPHGEQDYRGPHLVHLEQCHDIRLEDLRLRQAGNYAVYAHKCTNVLLRDVSIWGGHDGLHAQRCQDITLHACDFRTADDCIAGSDNRRVTVEACRFSTACNAFRFGVEEFTVRKCIFQGPGEVPHKLFVREGTPRQNMLSAFTHFSPKERNPTYPSDSWLIEDCWMDRIQSLYTWNYAVGTWQDGLPAKRLIFRRIHATNVARPLEVVGDSARSLDLTLEDVSIALTPESASSPVLDLFCFHALRLRNARLQNDGSAPLLRLRTGNLLEWSESDRQRLEPRSILHDLRDIHALP